MFHFTTPRPLSWTILIVFVAVLLFSFSCQAAPTPTNPQQARYKKIMTAYLSSHTPADLANFDADLKKLSGNDDIPWTVLVEPVGANGQNIVIVRDNVTRWDSSWTLYYWQADKWQAQELAYGFSLGLTAARQVLYQGQTEMLVAYDNSPDSNASEAGFDLWRWDGATWQRVWQSPTLNRRKVDATVELDDPALNTIHLKYDSWLLGEEKSQLFGESHAEPHRYFDEMWVRAGEGYRLAETRVQPSAYNTLVEFEYALQHQQFTTARQWATEAGLVERARQLQLEQLPIKREVTIGPATSTVADWTQTGPIVLEWQNRLITFSFTQQGEQWLLSTIEASPSATPTPVR